MRMWIWNNRKHLPPSEWERPGKVDWADALHVQMTKRDAIVLLGVIARRLENDTDDDFGFVLVGELVEMKK